MKSHEVNIAVNKTAEEVFHALKKVERWWSKDFEGNSAKVGDVFVICHPGQHYSKHEVVEMTPSAKVVWLVTESEMGWLQNNKQEWANTKMIFDISIYGDKTILHFTHEGLTPDKECYVRCTQGWNMIINDRLLPFITDNKGL